jgi:hypothetical protein
MSGKHLRHRGVYLMSALILLCTCTSCLHFQSQDSFTGAPDKVLFERGMSAGEDGKCDVARLTLETLVNTYPDSDYAARAEEVLKDPSFAVCRGWRTPAESNDNQGMTFFPN